MSCALVTGVQTCALPILRGQAFACWGAVPVSVVLLAAEVERLALFPAFAAPRRLAGALAVLRHRLAGPVRRAGAQRVGVDRGIAVAILDAATGAGGDDDGKQDWQAHAGDPFVRRGPRLCRSRGAGARSRLTPGLGQEAQELDARAQLGRAQ